MTRADRWSAVVLLAFAAAFTAGALKFHRYWDDTGPGSGFLPSWLGLVMAALALLLLLRRPRAVDAGVEWMPRGEGRTRMLIVMALTVTFVALLKVTGMILGTGLYLVAVVSIFGKHRWWIAIVVALAAAGFNWLVFAHWLRVPFPRGMLWTS